MTSPTAASTDVLASVRELCHNLEPAAMSADVALTFDTLVEMRRLVDGAVTRLSPFYARSGAWKDRGATSAAEAIARGTGQSPAQSRRRIETGRHLEKKGALDDAVRGGAVSTDQAQIIGDAADSDDDVAELLETARTSTHQGLREEAARVRARNDPDDASRRDRQRRKRSARRWTDEAGMYNLHLVAPPEVGAEIDARLKPAIDRLFEAARAEGRREPVPSYVADAVIEALTSNGATVSGSKSQAVAPQRKVIALVDIDALNRGAAVGGETCELAGVGPVSVSAIRALFGDAAMAVVFRDAVDIRAVVHLGRHVTAVQRTALESRGARCSVCRSTHQLEIDHTIGWTYTKVTTVDHLDWLCSSCHSLKSQRNLLAIGPPGTRVLVERDPKSPAQPRQPIAQIRPAVDPPRPEPPPLGASEPALFAT